MALLEPTSGTAKTPMIIMNKLVPGWFAIGGAIAVASYFAEVFDKFPKPRIKTSLNPVNP